MPEGDTVFHAAQRLSGALAGRQVTRFDLRVPRLALADLTGTEVSAVVAVGKHLLMRFDSGQTLHSHLRMDGSWILGRTGALRAGPGHAIRAIVGTADWTTAGVRVHDLALIDTRNESDLIGHLGPDLLDPNFDRAEARRRWDAAGDQPVGDLLLDQRIVAGIGNVYKSELLFLHRLDPWRPADQTPDPDALINDAARLLRANQSRTMRSTTGWTQRGQQYYVYGRVGRPCRTCGTLISKAEQGPPGTERVLFFCRSCQHVDRSH